MKNHSILFLLLVVSFMVTAHKSVSQAVCPTDITLTTQAEVDAFTATYSCTELTGMLTISGSDITNLHGLSAITSIGTLYISGNDALTNLNGLSNLITIGNTCFCSIPGLVIENNSSLTNLHGLSSLSRIEGSLYMFNNGQMVDLEGLETIASIGGMLYIKNNAKLTSINALSVVATVGVLLLSSQSVEISDNPSLTRISILNELTSLQGNVWIENNASLTAIDGFSSLTQIRGENASVSITGNPLLTNLNGFAALNTIDGSRRGAVITITNNASLTTLNGFSSLTNINGSINGGLVITNNQALTEVDGLSQLVSITGATFYLRISDNPMLDRGCGLYPLLSANGVGGDWCDNSTCPAIIISGNGTNCTREIILTGGQCSPVVECPADRVVIAEDTSGCGTFSTMISVLNPEANVTYTLRDNQNNSAVAGPSPGDVGLPTGQISETTVYNVVARNCSTGCEVVMSSMPVVTLFALPQDYSVVAENDSILSGTSTTIRVPEGEPGIMYTLRSDEDNSIVAGPVAGPAILPTGILVETTTYNVLAFCEHCEKELSTKVTVLVVAPTVVTGTAVNTTASMSFYPNPNNGEFKIQFANDVSGHYHLSLYNLTGSLMKEKSIDTLGELNTTQIDLKPLPAGTYFVSITGSGGMHMRSRLIITN